MSCFVVQPLWGCEVAARGKKRKERREGRGEEAAIGKVYFILPAFVARYAGITWR